jgi:hypothetical protein
MSFGFFFEKRARHNRFLEFGYVHDAERAAGIAYANFVGSSANGRKRFEVRRLTPDLHHEQVLSSLSASRLGKRR